jgi:hypothetical protein
VIRFLACWDSRSLSSSNPSTPANSPSLARPTENFRTSSCQILQSSDMASLHASDDTSRAEDEKKDETTEVYTVAVERQDDLQRALSPRMVQMSECPACSLHRPPSDGDIVRSCCWVRTVYLCVASPSDLTRFLRTSSEGLSDQVTGWGPVRL